MGVFNGIGKMYLFSQIKADLIGRTIRPNAGPINNNFRPRPKMVGVC